MSCLSTGTEYLPSVKCHVANHTAMHAEFAQQSVCHVGIDGALICCNLFLQNILEK